MIERELDEGRGPKEADLVSDSILVVEPVVEELTEIPVEVAEQDDRGGSRLGNRCGDS